MKKLHLLLLSVTLCLFSACHNDIWDAIDELDGRVTKLEELCKEMNTNITSLQTIVDVLQANDYITGIVEIKKNGEVIGYTITFGKHDPITIYHGQDGKDGADGKDGQDGSANAPVIGVAQDTDGVYYWTLNGEWLLDDNGNKLPVSGKDGQNGTNGSNGQDGKDGITPQLKIEEGYWYISYDNGATWTQLGKATGEDGKDGTDGEDGKDGQNGTDGKDGQDGDSMFQSVTQDENYVYFTLADGTVIKIAKKTTNTNPSSSFHNNREFIDLGLPSGTKWAKENLNGTYCYGGIYPNTPLQDSIYLDGKILVEGASINGTVYDVASYEWGNGWQLPTIVDFQELIDNTIVSYVSDGGIMLQSKINGRTITFQFSNSPEPTYCGNSSTTYRWNGTYLSSTAYEGLEVVMSRSYHRYEGGYYESYSINPIDISTNNFYLVRPVCK